MNAKELQKLLDIINEMAENTKEAGEKSAEFAEWVFDRMEEAGVSALLNDRVMRSSTRTSAGGYFDALYLTEYEYYPTSGNLLETKISTGPGDGYYVHGDFHAFSSYPTRAEVKKFAKLAPNIIETLATVAEEVIAFPNVA